METMNMNNREQDLIKKEILKKEAEQMRKKYSSIIKLKQEI